MRYVCTLHSAEALAVGCARGTYLLPLSGTEARSVRRAPPHRPYVKKQGLYDRPDGTRRRFPGHWPSPGAEALAVAEAGSLAGAKIFLFYKYY